MKKISNLTVVLSNCLSGGTAWTSMSSDMIYNLKQQLKNVSGLEFKEVNSNTVRGEHNSFTLILTSVIYDWTIKHSKEKSSELLEYIRNAVNQVTELNYSEIRIEHTRTFSAL